ncbi:MAG: tyrosine-type recombinase/integrase, partial [Eubacterium sp.]
PIPDPLRAILWPWRGVPDVFLFTGDVNHSPLSKTVAERIWVELMLACDMVGSAPDTNQYRDGDIRSQYVPLITPHTLRHNYITLCWENGIDVYTTMRLVGHANYKTTMD